MNSKCKTLQKRFVVAGEKLANVEEFVPINNETIYEDKGALYAAINGCLTVNYRDRTINLIHAFPQKRPKIKVGDLVIARVIIMRKFTVGTLIHKINKKVLFDYNPVGNIHVSNIANYYIDRVTEAFKKSDWVRARVIELGVELELSTDGRNLGVIKADCPTCGTELIKMSRDTLQCPFCGRKERRKTSFDYGFVEEPFVI
ncbi:MAG: exosome complex RNA-binding protein Csl4 [Promethearchaeota archaeon]